MSRALKAGLERYPEKIIGTERTLIDTKVPIDANLGKRIIFMEGYKQAEKDLALTWEDIAKINQIHFEVMAELDPETTSPVSIHEEVLCRFNEYKNK